MQPQPDDRRRVSADSGGGDPTGRSHVAKRLFHEVLERPATERAAFLDDACDGDSDLRAEVEARGVEFRPVGLDVREGLSRNADALLAGRITSVRAAYAWFRATARKQMAQLPELTGDVDRIIGASIQIGAPSAAELHGIPYRYVVFCPALLPSAQYPPMVVAAQTLPRWLNSLAWKVFSTSSRTWSASTIRIGPT